MIDDPSSGAERQYHAVTRGLLINEIFRRVEPEGRTMSEYFRDEFSDIDIYAGAHKMDAGDRVKDIRFSEIIR